MDLRFKIFFLTFFLYLFTTNVFAQIYWSKTESPTSQNLRKCCFVNPQFGWAAGDSGTIIHTSNGGADWVLQNTNVENGINDIFFINERLGWALTLQIKPDSVFYTGTIILKTTNGGINWSASNFLDTNYYYGSIYFLDSLRGFAGGFPKFIYYTTDGGQRWSEAVSDSGSLSTFPVSNFTFYDDQFGYAGGGLRDLAGIVWTTTNSGMSWNPRILGPDPVNDIIILDVNRAIGISGDFKFGANYFYTNDQWASSENVSLDYFGIMTSISFRNQMEGWATIGNQQKFFHTLNGGANWTITDPPDSTAILDIEFIDTSNGWAVGNKGAILKYIPNPTGINSIQLLTTAAAFLYQNYPNPFNPVTTIRYECPVLSSVKLRIFDAVGKEVSTLVNHKQFPGSYSVEFDGSMLASGVYFYQLEVSNEISGKNNFVKTNRMLLLK